MKTYRVTLWNLEERAYIIRAETPERAQEYAAKGFYPKDHPEHQGRMLAGRFVYGESVDEPAPEVQEIET